MSGSELLYSFLVGGSVVSMVSYLSNYVSTELAAILASINISIFSTLFINKKEKALEFVWNEIFLMLVLSVMSIVYYTMYKYGDFQKGWVVITSYIFYIVAVYTLHQTVLKGSIKN